MSTISISATSRTARSACVATPALLKAPHGSRHAATSGAAAPKVASSNVRPSVSVKPAVGVAPAVFPLASTGKTRLRITDRGRRVLALIVALPIVAAVVFGVLSAVPASASRVDDGATSASFETVTVMGGDTLWSIAEEVAPNSDPRDVVYDIKTLNALTTTSLTAGQQLAIPSQYTDAAN